MVVGDYDGGCPALERHGKDLGRRDEAGIPGAEAENPLVDQVVAGIEEKADEEFLAGMDQIAAFLEDIGGRPDFDDMPVAEHGSGARREREGQFVHEAPWVGVKGRSWRRNWLYTAMEGGRIDTESRDGADG